MCFLSRRAFLGASAGLLSAELFAAAPPIQHPGKEMADAPFRPDTLFLTWQRDPTTTMTVQWVGTRGETSDNRIYYAKSSGGLWQAKSTEARPYAVTDFKVFRAELTGLSPGTDYQFRVGRESPTYRFRTMPARLSDSFSFVSGGDCGINAHAVANNIQAARQNPMFALVGGDLGYDNGRSVATSLAFLRNYSRHMVDGSKRLIPLVACIGNHEVNGGYNKPREKAPFFYAVFDGLFRETGYATLEFGDYLSLVLLDTGHTSPIGGEQAAWLEKTLKARKDHPNVLVANHVPAYPSYRNPLPAKGKDGKERPGTGDANRKHWVPLFEKYRVPVVLEHHDHTFKRTRPLLGGLVHDNGVLYLGDGSWGKLRAPRKPEKLPYLARASKDYHLSLHRIEAHGRYHMALDENGRVMDVCRSGQRRSGLIPVSD
jgi:phosphodiesterase/alkaline phosphatase D-like protein